MARYILIDNFSGYVWGDSADLDGRIFVGTPIEFALALDAHIGGEQGHTYEECGKRCLASNETGYQVFRADINGSDAVPVVRDGRQQKTIEDIVRSCEYVTTLRRIANEEA